MKNLGPVGHLLGLDIARTTSKGYTLNQANYINKLAQRHTTTKTRTAPLPTTYQDATADPTPAEQQAYQGIVGELLFSATWSRPDIAFSAGYLGRFSSSPTATHLQLAHHLLGYLLSTNNLSISYPYTAGQVYLSAYSDSDWAGD